MGNLVTSVISYLRNDLMDILLIVFIGTYYTIKELSLLQKLQNWVSKVPQFEDQQSLQLLKSTRKDNFAAVITGANGGLGLEIAKNLSGIGYTIIMACRSKANAEQAIKEIQQSHKGKDIKLDFIPLDLSSFESIEEFVKQLKSKNYKVDLLVNNAGLMFTEYSLTKDGLEMQIGVNHFGHFKLTMLMLPIMTQPSRIITVNSITHLSGSINFNDINSKNSYSKFYAYANSKLANIYFTKELAKRIKEKKLDIQCYGANPGSVYTNIVGSMPSFLGKLFHTFGPYLLKTPFQDKIDDRQSGETFFEAKLSETSVTDSSHHNQIAKKLWEVSEKITNSKFPL